MARQAIMEVVRACELIGVAALVWSVGWMVIFKLHDRKHGKGGGKA